MKSDGGKNIHQDKENKHENPHEAVPEEVASLAQSPHDAPVLRDDRLDPRHGSHTSLFFVKRPEFHTLLFLKNTQIRFLIGQL